MRKLLLTFALITPLVVLASSYVFNVKPVGRLDKSVAFEFHNESNKQIGTNISSFVVSERTPDGHWKPVWALSGERRHVKSITYGDKFPGLDETLPPKTLVAGKVYAVFVSDGNGGSASRYFRFGRDGAMVFPDSPDL